MASFNTPAANIAGDTPPMSKDWHYHPSLPIENAPLFAWPPHPKKIATWLANSWLRPSERLVYVALAILSWRYFQPALERCKDFEIGWIAQIYFRNLLLMALVAGGLHLFFYIFKKQGMTCKFNSSDLNGKGRNFLFHDQVSDNMFWSLASGVTFWTVYEAFLIWAYANHLIPTLTWDANPVWFLLLFPLIVIWQSFHFYWIHRFLHWPPLYKAAHGLHHRNVNVGPWSGLSMHPIEHAIYFSSVLLHLVIPSHPIHLFFHMYWLTLAAATSHVGFEGFIVRCKNRFALGSFHHQLHHRYFECNYGNTEMPWDKWFGSFHDGTPEATRRIRDQLRRKRQTA